MCANALADFQFVDRYQELGFLTNAADDPACRGVLVLGPPGIGKTSLVRVFALRRKESGQDTISPP